MDDASYYRKYHHFDPVDDMLISCRNPLRYCYELQFPLSRDPPLFHAGVTIGARVEVDWFKPPNDGGIENYLVFSRGAGERTVPCKHIEICTLQPGEKELNPRELVQIAKATPRHKIVLSPPEHFVALKAFAKTIAEEGLGAIMRRSFLSGYLLPGALPIGLNGGKQKAIFHALWEIAPSATQATVVKFFVDLTEEGESDSAFLELLGQALPLLDGIYDLKRALVRDPVALDSLAEMLPEDLVSALKSYLPRETQSTRSVK